MADALNLGHNPMFNLGKKYKCLYNIHIGLEILFLDWTKVIRADDNEE